MLLGVVVVKIGALEIEPKFNVPLLMEKTQGTVMGAEDELSASVQFALLPLRAMMFVPPGLTLPKRLVSTRVPERFSVVAPAPPTVLVRLPAMASRLLAPLKARLLLKFSPRLTSCELAELLMMSPPSATGFPFKTKGPAPGLKMKPGYRVPAAVSLVL